MERRKKISDVVTLPGRISKELEMVRREMAVKYNISKTESDKLIARMIKNSGMNIEFTMGKKRRKGNIKIRSEVYDDFNLF